MLDKDLENHILLPVTSRVKPNKGVPHEPIYAPFKIGCASPSPSFRLH